MTRYYHGWVLAHALKGAGALTIGIGVLPLVAAFGAAWPAPGEEPSRRCTPIAPCSSQPSCSSRSSPNQGAYNQYSFGTRIWERNMLYVAPLLFAATALWLDRRRLNLWATAVGTGIAAFLVAWTPYLMQYRLSSDSPGLSILAQANGASPSRRRTRRSRCSPSSRSRRRCSSCASRAASRPGDRRARCVVAVFVVAWNLTGELSASASTNSISRTFESKSAVIPTGSTGHARSTAIYLAQQAQVQGDQNSEWLLEFWNRSIQRSSCSTGASAARVRRRHRTSSARPAC